MPYQQETLLAPGPVRASHVRLILRSCMEPFKPLVWVDLTPRAPLFTAPLLHPSLHTTRSAFGNFSDVWLTG